MLHLRVMVLLRRSENQVRYSQNFCTHFFSRPHGDSSKEVHSRQAVWVYLCRESKVWRRPSAQGCFGRGWPDPPATERALFQGGGSGRSPRQLLPLEHPPRPQGEEQQGTVHASGAAVHVGQELSPQRPPLRGVWLQIPVLWGGRRDCLSSAEDQLLPGPQLPHRQCSISPPQRPPQEVTAPVE